VTQDVRAGGPAKTVVLGLQNILLGDEGVGVHVVEELQRSGGLPGRIFPGKRARDGRAPLGDGGPSEPAIALARFLE
jgi:hypothetical protein